MKKYITLLFLCITFLSYSQIRIDDIVVPEKLTFEGEELTYNGGAMRTVLAFKTYAGALYTQNRYFNDKEVLDADEPMAIRLNIASKKVNSDRMVKVFKKGFNDAMFGNTKSIDDRISKFLELFSERIQINDYFDMVYVKGKGIKTFKNGQELGFIEGRDFKYALFKIWLGNQPACEIIKGGMLGQTK